MFEGPSIASSPTLPSRLCVRARADIQLNSVLGSAKEIIGTGIEYATGAKEPSSWTTAGKEQHAKGEAEIKAAQAQGYVEG
jgi:hypothetical protein